MTNVLQMNTKRDRMLDDCRTHAREAMSSAVGKGLDPHTAAVAMCVESWAMIFGLSQTEASSVMQHASAYVLETLLEGVIAREVAEECSPETEKALRSLKKEIDSEYVRQSYGRPLDENLVAKAKDRIDAGIA